jgi:hypothetical protein
VNKLAVLNGFITHLCSQKKKKKKEKKEKKKNKKRAVLMKEAYLLLV